MAKKKSAPRFDAAGWWFWLAVFAVVLGPCIYLIYSIKLSRTGWMAVIGFGAMLAALLSGVLTWAINEVVQRRAAKQRAESAPSRKKKRKKKK